MPNKTAWFSSRLTGETVSQIPVFAQLSPSTDFFQSAALKHNKPLPQSQKDKAHGVVAPAVAAVTLSEGWMCL